MLRFKSSSDFQKEVRQRVRSYFKETGKSGLADYRYVIKAVANMSLYLVPFVLFLSGFQSIGWTLLLWAITGIGMAGVGMNLMHDALHNTLTRSEWINRKLVPLFICFVEIHTHGVCSTMLSTTRILT